MNILDSMKDIVKHVSAPGVIEMVKIVGSTTDARIETVDPDKSIVIFGQLYQPIKDIDSTIGLSRLQVLKGYMNLNAESSVEVVKELRGTDNVPVELKFDDKNGAVANYRFMSEAMINEQIAILPFNNKTWDVSFSPDRKSIAALSNYQGILGGYEKRFTVNMNSNTLNFAIGSGPSDRVNLPFAHNVSGSLKSQWSYPMALILNILKLNETSASTTMNFSDRGVLKIDIDSSLGLYSYIILAAQS